MHKTGPIWGGICLFSALDPKEEREKKGELRWVWTGRGGVGRGRMGRMRLGWWWWWW